MDVNTFTYLVELLISLLVIHAFTIQSIGSGEGQTIGVDELRSYLRAFGYLNDGIPKNSSNHMIDNNNLEYDEQLVSALKLFQRNYHLNVTGKLNPKTVELLSTTK